MEYGEIQLIDMFKSCCEYHFSVNFRKYKYLYFDKIPLSYFGTGFTIKLSSISFDWIKTPDIIYDAFYNDSTNHIDNRCVFKQECKIDYSVNLNSIELSKQTKRINFSAYTFEPFGHSISPSLIIDDLIIIDKFEKVKADIKESFKIINLDDVEYSKDVYGLSYFTNVILKERQTKTLEKNIPYTYFYEEIKYCHKEIEECLLAVLLHQKYSSDLLGRNYKHEGEEFYMPNLRQPDFQYLMMAGFAFDRLYSFWDRITVLLYNYNQMNIKKSANISFTSYFNILEDRVSKGEPIIFDKQSKNLNWLINFSKNNFKQITKYRHRIVHYQFTKNWEGVLPAKFAANTSDFVSDKKRLLELKQEFESFGNILLEQFNYCTNGFNTSLKLIDELK